MSPFRKGKATVDDVGGLIIAPYTITPQRFLEHSSLQRMFSRNKRCQLLSGSAITVSYVSH